MQFGKRVTVSAAGTTVDREVQVVTLGGGYAHVLAKDVLREEIKVVGEAGVTAEHVWVTVCFVLVQFVEAAEDGATSVADETHETLPLAGQADFVSFILWLPTDCSLELPAYGSL